MLSGHVDAGKHELQCVVAPNRFVGAAENKGVFIAALDGQHFLHGEIKVRMRADDRVRAFGNADFQEPLNRRGIISKRFFCIHEA